ncbi:hypothetical protein DP116_24435 [Brasilonema bromeliae SPC951]|uniref:Uncharacterized protein n=1 Tax=Brasilonema bromeliae SPC951 TaxID=385972 RepID=A0ABX1PD49_9CYAN|nr:hypothetical protein [Brasilonema bromeliae SPC951]
MMLTLFCAVSGWAILMFLIWNVWITLKTGASHLKTLHQIPCSGCEYFTNDYRLKCTVHPVKACSPEALGCLDFEPKTDCCNANQKRPRKLCK